MDRQPLHTHISKAAKAWNAAHLTHTKRANVATTAREDKRAAEKAANDMNSPTKAKP